MKGIVWIAYSVMWMSVASAVIYAIYKTGNTMTLLCFVIPACVNFRTTD